MASLTFVNCAYADALTPEAPVVPIPKFTQTEFGNKDNYTHVIKNIDIKNITYAQYIEFMLDKEGINLEEILENPEAREEYEQLKDIKLSEVLGNMTNLIIDAEGNILNEEVPEGIPMEFFDKYGEKLVQYYIDSDEINKIDGEALEFVPKSKSDRKIITGEHNLNNGYTNVENMSENCEISPINTDFIANNTNGYYGYFERAFYNENSNVIENIKSDFIGNTDIIGVYNEGEIGSINSNFIGNTLNIGNNGNGIRENSFALINNFGTIKNGIINSNFINNTNVIRLSYREQQYDWERNTELGKFKHQIRSDFYSAHILSSNDLNIEANQGKNSIISGNTTVYNIWPYNESGETYNAVNKTAIFTYGTAEKPTVLSLTAKTGGKLVIDDEISGNNYKIKVTGDKTGIVYLNNNIRAYNKNEEDWKFITGYGRRESSEKDDKYGSYNEWLDSNIISDTSIPADITLENTNLVLGRSASVLDGHNLTLNSGALSLANGEIGMSALNSLTVTGNTNFFADVDLANSQMDRISAKTYGKHTGNLNVSGMNLLSDAKTDKTEIYFAENGLKDNVTTTVSEVAYTPIYKYSVKYDNRNDGGYFVFNRSVTGGGSNGGNPSEAFNPSVLSTPIAGVAASQATVNETFKYVFEHADAFTKLPEQVRQAKINANKYALSTDFNHNLGSLCPEHNNKAGWFKPYVTFEKIDLKNGPKVNATTYGSLAGFDTDFFEHKNGWHSVGTGYVGYNGSQLRYKGIDTTMNGGILGYTHTMYKGNFWSALTLSAGASVGQSNTMYGKEDFTSLLAGVGSKTGYNFEFKEGKYILQPVMFLSYTFVNTFDYTNAAGVKINADPAHSIQLNPSVRFIANTKNGWQPYASVGMVWNVMNENKVTANEVRLPEMGMKPYVEYGVGIQKNWKDRFTAFGQAMLRNGGRTGIALTGGFRWAIGREGKPIDKVQGVNDKKISLQSTTSGKHNEESLTSSRKILKQLTPQQKMALTGKKNTTITINNGILKQL